MEPIAVFLCDRTGAMAEPWAEAGITCYCVDIQHSIRKERVEGIIHFVWGDARSWTPPAGHPIVFVAAFPPCTHVAVSGAKHFRAKGLGKLIEALEILNACRKICEAADCPYMIENPISVFSSYWREPDYYFHPWQFTRFALGDHYTKKSCLWTGGGFVMPEPCPDGTLAGIAPDDRIHKAPPSEDRGDIRSETPRGFCWAVFEANHHTQEGIR